MSNLSFTEFNRIFHICGGLLFSGTVSSILSVFGLWVLAVGFLVGCLLFVLNLLFLYESGRALIRLEGRERAGAMAGCSSLGRILFLGVALALLAQVSVPAFCAACGGLIFSQTGLRLIYIRQRRRADA